MKEESPAYQRRIQKRHTAMQGGSGWRDSPTKDSHIPVEAVHIPESLQQCVKTHKEHKVLAVVNENTERHKVTVPKHSVFRMEEYNEPKKVQQTAKLQKRGAAFNLRTLNMYKRAKKEEKDNFCSVFKSNCENTTPPILPSITKTRSNKAHQLLNATIEPAEKSSPIRVVRGARKMTYDFTMTQQGPS